jgi:aspartate racemase
MKTIGLIGGLTWLSTIDYYRLLNQKVNEKLGGVASAKLVLYSLEFEEIKRLTMADDWQGLASKMIDAGKKLSMAGAECLLICANTMHHIADDVAAAIDIPLIHIAEATAKAIAKKGLKKVALLGTKYTMTLPFYTGKLAEFGIETIIPEPDDIAFLNNAIYEEMGKGIFLTETKAKTIEIISKLEQLGAEGVILGCTELPILLKNEVHHLPFFDTTQVHVEAALDFALA